MTEVTTTKGEVQPFYARALLRYRIMAYATGVALLTATTLFIVVHGFGETQFKTVNGLAWVAHGWLFLIYVITALVLGVNLRWHLVRLGLILLAGTIPLLSFVAERYTTKRAPADSVARDAR